MSRSLLCNAVCVVLLILSYTSIAQPMRRQVKTEMAVDFKKRKLIVMLLSEDKKVSEKLNPAEIKAYRENLAKTNRDLQYTIKTFWTFNTSIQFLTGEQISALGSNDAYGLMALDVINIKYAGQISRKPVNHVVRMHISFLENYDPIKPMFYADMVGFLDKYSVPDLGKRDFISSALLIQNHMEARVAGKNRPSGYSLIEAHENGGLLKSKILLVDTLYLEKMLSEEDKATYGFALEISNEKAIEKALSKKDGKYAHVYLVPEISDAAQYFYHYVIDCSTGLVISYSVPMGFHMKNYIDKAHLKNYAKNSEKGKKKEK
jgi:hypothetical protein